MPAAGTDRDLYKAVSRCSLKRSAAIRALDSSCRGMLLMSEEKGLSGFSRLISQLVFPGEGSGNSQTCTCTKPSPQPSQSSLPQSGPNSTHSEVDEAIHTLLSQVNIHSKARQARLGEHTTGQQHRAIVVLQCPALFSPYHLVPTVSMGPPRPWAL